MAEDHSKYQSTFEKEVKGAVVGNENIIYNYFYYREEVKPTSFGVADESLPCPYRGLFHFGPNDADVFFGREIFIEELYRATQTRNFIPVLGASGSGKSSVVLAGLVPKLQKAGNWQFTHFRPGSDPFHALALALVPLYTPNLDQTDKIAQARKLADYLQQGSVPLSEVFAAIQQNYPNHRLLLIADQFEEIYTLCKNQEIRRKFLDCLLSSLATPTSLSSSATVLVTTMRADFLGNALSYRPFADVLQNADLKLGPMNREELTQVIEKPAQKLGVTFESGLVERILEDVENQPGNLPLLEFALTELWNKRTGKQLTHKIYEEIGQVEGALARHADEKYGNLTEEEKEKVRRIFIQLVRPGEGAEDTRRIAIKAELGEQSWDLVKQLADARLVVTSRNATSQETVEIVHEALIRNWGELHQWMETNRVFRAWQERLRAAKGQWEATQRDSGSLLRGAALAEAEEKLKERPEDLIDEQEFIEQSIKEGNRLQQIEAARRKREIRTAWGIAAGSLVGVMITMGFYLMGQQQLVQTIRSLTNNSQELFDSNKEFDALLTSLNAGKNLKQLAFGANPDLKMQIKDALQNPIIWINERNRLEGHKGGVQSVSFSPDGEVMASDGADGIINLWNVKTGNKLYNLDKKKLGIGSFNLINNGLLAFDSKDDTIKLWNIKTGQVVTSKTLDKKKLGIKNVVSFSSNGWIASQSADDTLKIWDVTTGNVINTLKADKLNFQGSDFIFSPDGQRLAFIIGRSGGVSEMTFTFWNVTTGNVISTFKTPASGFNGGINFSPNNQRFAYGGEERIIHLLDVATGQEIKTLKGHTERISSISFSLDGQILASGAWNEAIKLWDVETGEEIKTFTGHKTLIQNVSFSPKANLLASAGEDGIVKLWDISPHKEVISFDYAVGDGISFSPDGKLLAYNTDQPNTIKLWDVSTHKKITTLIGHYGWIKSVSFSPDGQWLASAAWDGTIKLWDVNTCIKTRDCKASETLDSKRSPYLSSVSFSPDGRLLASAGNVNWNRHNEIQIWDVSTHPTNPQPIKILIGHTNFINSVSFSPDGKLLASGSSDQTIKIWDVANGKEINTLTGHSDEVKGVSFSLNGQLASASHDQTIKIWDVANGKEITTLKGHTAPVIRVSFSRDGKILVSGSNDKTIKIWDVATGKEITTLRGHKTDIRNLSLSDDGQLLVSGGSSEEKLILWNVKILSNLTFEELMAKGCDWVHGYLKTNPRVSDRHLCDGIGREK